MILVTWCGWQKDVSLLIPGVNYERRHGQKIDYIHHIQHIFLNQVMSGHFGVTFGHMSHEVNWGQLRSTFGCLEAEIRKAISIMKKQLKTTSIIRKPNSNAANDFTILTGINRQIRGQRLVQIDLVQIEVTQIESVPIKSFRGSLTFNTK